jgi:hypothetical protein
LSRNSEKKADLVLFAHVCVSVGQGGDPGDSGRKPAGKIEG